LLIGVVASVLSGCAPAFGPRPVPLDMAGAADWPVAGEPSACPPRAVEQRATHANRHVARLQALRERVQERRENGSASVTDVAQVEARLAAARARLARAEADLAISRAALAEATGRFDACPPHH
jgi:hypothetical protein